jgi:lipoate-protein ligase B
MNAKHPLRPGPDEIAAAVAPDVATAPVARRPIAGPPSRPDGPPVLRWTDLGRCDYRHAWHLQQAQVARRKAGLDHDRLLLVEHEPVLTLGRRAHEENIKADRRWLAGQGVELVPVERGGDVTYHGPGQLVAYPILDLHGHRKDVRWFAATLLEVVARTVRAFGLPAEVREGRDTGVWLPADGLAPASKIAALGVRVERWIGYHGVALNVDPDLSHFGWIVPCGLPEAHTTSLRAALGRSITIEEVRPVFLDAFAAAFAVRLQPSPRDEWPAISEEEAP